MIRTLALGTAALVWASAAAAVTIDVETWSTGAYDTATAGWAQKTVETFEGFSMGQITGPLATDVGSFATLGGTGSGASIIGDMPGNTDKGTDLAIRTAPNHGRVNTTTGGKTFLDSNDTLGMVWAVALAGGTMFDRLVFSLSDAADQGATLSILAGDSELTTFVGKTNGVVQLIEIRFGSLVSGATITLSNNGKLNDGFAVDDVTVGAVPLPAGGVLLLTGLGGLALFRRRRA